MGWWSKIADDILGSDPNGGGIKDVLGSGLGGLVSNPTNEVSWWSDVFSGKFGGSVDKMYKGHNGMMGNMVQDLGIKGWVGDHPDLTAAAVVASVWGGSALMGSGAGGATGATTAAEGAGTVSSSLPTSIAEYGATTNTIGGGFTSADVATGVANSGAAIGPGASSSWMDLLDNLPSGSNSQQQPQSNSSQDSAILSAIKASIMLNPLQDLAKQQMDILGREKKQGGANGLA